MNFARLLRAATVAMFVTPPVMAQQALPGTVGAPGPDGFSLDLSLEDVRKELGILTYSELPFGKKFEAGSWNFCRHEGGLWIRGYSEVRQSELKYLSWISVTRSADGYDVSLEKSRKGELDYKTLEKLLLVAECERAARAKGGTLEELELGPVLTVQGTKTASELLALVRGQ